MQQEGLSPFSCLWSCIFCALLGLIVRYNIEFDMATTFGGSRLANLREKRTSGDDLGLQKKESLKLSMPDQTEDVAYQPSSSTSSFLSRTQTRLLKGRIERPPAEKEETHHNQNNNEPNSRPKLTLSGGEKQQLKLVLNDGPVKEERRVSVEQNSMRTTQKRIMITKAPEPVNVPEKAVEQPKNNTQQPKAQTHEPEPEKPIVFNEEKPIKEEDIEESMPGETDLVECPEGCGRKFNRKALEKHAKACKLVFMSKRKEFNSEAKRLVNKEQAAIIKQQKEKQKKEGRSRGSKAFEKTSDNWKAASEDFRAAVKAIKKDNVEDEQQNGEDVEKQEMKILACKYCEKPFAEVFMEKHMQGCSKRKQADKKKTFKKK